MSIDFDSAALQTQHDEEEYDQEDYAREQELQKLLTDLPDDMLEDSRDSSSPELEYSACSHKNTGNSPQSTWTQQWSVHPRPTSHEQEDYAYEDGAVQINGHLGHPQSQPLPHTWNQQPQGHQFTEGDYTYTSMGTERSTETNDFSTDEYGSKPYTQGTNTCAVYEEEGGHRENQNYGDHNNGRNYFQNSRSAAGDKIVDPFKASYNPHHPAHQPTLNKMFNAKAAHQQGQLDNLQREFLDSTQQPADREQLAQLQILNQAQHRQIEDLERKLEDSRRNMRYLEHQFAIAKDEKDGLAVSLKESSRLVEESKERELQMQNKLKAMEQQVQLLNERDQENTKKQRVAEAAVDSLKQQLLELCRSDTLSKSRQQHDRDLTIMKEQHDSALLTLQQKLDSNSQALDEQMDVGQRFREQVKQLERQREEEQLERARVVNGLTQRLEESQQQCAKLLQTSSVQELTQLQVKLQQAQSAKTLSENMNRVLQEDLSDLKEQITLYESAVKHGVIALDLSSEWENQLSESCMDLGLKKINRKNGLHSPAVAHLSDSKLPKDEALRLLRMEMQRCLGSLKGKRQKISQLQEELQLSQTSVNELQTQLDEAKLSLSVRETAQHKHLDLTGESQKEFIQLQEDKRHLQEQVEVLEKKNKELKHGEEKVRSANAELCTKMREMIQELDQEKQEAAQRSERIHQQYRDDVVHQIRTELMLEHDAQIEQLTEQNQQQVQQFQSQLTEVNDKMLAVQECYLSVCKEKDMLEESIRSREKDEEASVKDNEQKLREESDTAVVKLRAELEAQHQASLNQIKALWSKEKEVEIQLQVTSQVDSAKAAWGETLQKAEETWAQRLEEAKRDRETAEASCQMDHTNTSRVMITVEEVDSRLGAQKQQLQLEADKVKRKAVEEARKQVQRELNEKHLEDMAKQVEGAVTRAYNRWIEDLTSLPEYQTALQTERAKWETLYEKHTEQQVSKALRETEEQWHKKHRNQLGEQSSGTQKIEELQGEMAALHSQLEQVRSEQAALLKAELAGARAIWNRDKQQEISVIQARTEQVYQNEMQEQHKKLEQALLHDREDADLQKKEILVQMEAKLQQTLRVREEEWRCQRAEREQNQRQQMRDEFVKELQACLAEVQKHLHRTPTKTDHQVTEDTRRSSGASSDNTIKQIIQTFCKDTVSRAVSHAKKEWKKISEETLSQVLKETQQQHEREINTMQTSASQRKEQLHCKKECTETVSKLQKKNQELQRHLEKACRQLQNTVREHKTAMQHLKDEHESSLQKATGEHLQQLEEARRAKESSGSSDQQQNIQQGLEEMKQQYMSTVEKIRGDMLRYLQESRERAAEMIRTEVQRERQDTARKMRRYYLTCLQELLEDGGKTTGAEKKIMNAASKLAAMAKVLETPIKSKSGQNSSQTVSSAGCPSSRHTGYSKTPSTLPELPDIRPEDRSLREKTSADSEQKQTAAVRTKPSVSRKEEASTAAEIKHQTSTHSHLRALKPSQQMSSSSQVDCVDVSVRSKNRELYLQGGNPKAIDLQQQSRPFVVQEAPVREERRTDWSLTSSDSETGLQVARLSISGRKVEPVKPFSASPSSACDFGEFGGLTPDVSDLTVYNEIAKRTPHIQTSNFPNAKLSSHREPTPGSEGEKQQGVCSRPVFSELRQRQQDSGFDSPFYQHK